MRKNIFRSIGMGGIVGSLMLSACTLDIPLEDQYSDPDAIATVQNARSLLTSAYIAYPHAEYDLSVLGPDFCPTSLTGKDSEQKNLYNWQDKSINKLSQQLWLDYYNVISICDVLQERLSDVKCENEEEQKKLTVIEAESYTMEAMCYFNLLRLFSPAYDQDPQGAGIILKNRVGVEFPSRSTKSECVREIRTLLQKALLVESAPERNGWLSKDAATYLLAELELYAGNYEAAAENAKQLVEKAKPAYFTESGYAKLWEEASCAERIFAFNQSAPIYVSLEYDEKEGDYFAVTPEVVFEEDDYRSAFSIYPFGMDGEERRLFGKYNKNNKEGHKNSYLNVMRYAGAYFICAEAYSHLPGQEGKARAYLNEYLSYCGASPISDYLEGEDLINAILKEKLKEFVGEGVAYFDMKRLHNKGLQRWIRWGKMSVGLVDVSDYRWTFPIPSSETKNNENVAQNEGWPINR